MRFRTWALNALLVAGSVALTLGVAMLADRWLGLGIGRSVGLLFSRSIQAAEPIMYVYDNRTGWRLNPLTQYHSGVSGPFLGLAGTAPSDIHLRVNSDGFIDREHFVATSRYRIAFVGNSWVEAVQQEFTDRFTPLTEDYVFAQSNHEKVVEVMNFGVSNLAPAQAYGVIKTYVLKYHPDEVWLFAGVGDLGSNSPAMTPPPFGPTFEYADASRTKLADIRFGFVDPPAYTAWKRQLELGRFMEAAPSLASVTPYFYSTEGTPAADRLWGDMRLTIGLIRSALAASGVRMRLVYLPTSAEAGLGWDEFRARSAKLLGREIPMDPSAGEKRFAALARDLDIEFVSLLPLSREKGAKEMFAGHFSRMGHHYVAQYLADLIIRTAPPAAVAVH